MLQTVWTQIILLLLEQSDQGSKCLLPFGLECIPASHDSCRLLSPQLMSFCAYVANSMDPDHTAPSWSSLIRVHSVCFHLDWSVFLLVMTIVVCSLFSLGTFVAYVANSMDPDQTAPFGS